MARILRTLLAAGPAVAIAALLVWLPPVGASEPARLGATTIKVGNNFFSPSSKTISRGSSVSWVWAGGRRHDVVGRNSRGKVVFRSRRTSRRGYRFRQRFRNRGSYRVICTVHPAKMRMTVRVR